VPRQYGGFGAEPDVFEAMVIAEEFGKAGVNPGMMNQGVSMFVPTLLEVGTKEQCREWIGPTIRGDVIWCQGYSEPGAGSDLAAVRTRAHLEDGHFIVNGHKIWTSSAHYADMIFLLCRTEPDASKHKGLSYLILSMKSPGIRVQPIKTATGRSEFNEVFFENVRVPMHQIVKGRGDGWEVTNITLKHERLGIGDANRLGYRLKRILNLLRDTEVDGSRLIEMPEYLTRVITLQGELIAWKAHYRRMQTQIARGIEPGVNRLIIKYGGTMIGHRLSALAVDALGAVGAVFESEGEDAQDDEVANWNNDYLYDIGLLIGGGTLNIQKNIISERGLGMPREPKAAAEAKGTV
jgi:alkylation response protein AidB-like acyl-CoA dehydrogenase